MNDSEFSYSLFIIILLLQRFIMYLLICKEKNRYNFLVIKYFINKIFSLIYYYFFFKYFDRPLEIKSQNVSHKKI